MTHADVAERIRHTFTRHDVVRGDETRCNALRSLMSSSCYERCPAAARRIGRIVIGVSADAGGGRRWRSWPCSRRAQQAINARRGFGFLNDPGNALLCG
jgi:hypothetical protein